MRRFSAPRLAVAAACLLAGPGSAAAAPVPSASPAAPPRLDRPGPAPSASPESAAPAPRLDAPPAPVPSASPESAAPAPVPSAIREARPAPLAPVPSARPARPPRTVVRTDLTATAEQRILDRDNPGFATAVDLRRDRSARTGDALPEVLARTAGVHVRSLGGLGQFSALSLRGSSAQQVGVFLDGVPIGGGSSGVVNLADFPLDTLGRLTVHRGLVPVAYGGAAIGGAIDLGSDLRCVRDARRLTAAAGFGSFLAREARVATSVPLLARRKHAPCIDVRAGYGGARGDFPFLNIGETPQNTADDRTTRRQNNHYDRVLGQLAVHGRSGAWRYSAQQLILWKRQGIPGTATGVQASATGLATVVARTVARVRRDLPTTSPGQVELVTGFAAEHAHYTDPRGEVGLAVDDQRTRTLDLYASPRLHLHAWRGGSLAALVDARQEWTRVDQRAWPDPEGDARRRRLTTGAGLQVDQRLLADRIHLQPVVRLDVVNSRFLVDPGAGEPADQGRDHLDVGFSPRLGARFNLLDQLSLRLTGGRYFRPPSMLELFGDRGYIAGNEALRPERGTSLDGGLVVDASTPSTALYAHAAGFVTWSDNLIQWQQAGPRLRPVNLDRARVAGLETSLDLRLARGDVIVRGSYTLLAPINLGDEPTTHGQPLPGRPRHDLFAQLSLGHVFKARATDLEPRLVYSLDHAARTFLDASGRYEVPRRTLHGLGLELHIARRVHITADVRNLLNQRTTLWHPPIAGAPALPVPISDFFFYPLPGTSFWAAVRLDLNLPTRST